MYKTDTNNSYKNKHLSHELHPELSRISCPLSIYVSVSLFPLTFLCRNSGICNNQYSYILLNTHPGVVGLHPLQYCVTMNAPYPYQRMYCEYFTGLHHIKSWRNILLSGPCCVWSYPWWCHQMETFSALLAICAGNSPVNSPHKGQWRTALMFYLMLLNNGEAGECRRPPPPTPAHFNVTVMKYCRIQMVPCRGITPSDQHRGDWFNIFSPSNIWNLILKNHGLIQMMGIPILVGWYLYIQSAPDILHWVHQC